MKKIITLICLIIFLEAKTEVEVFDIYKKLENKKQNIYGLSLEYKSRTYKDAMYVDIKFSSISDDGNISFESLQKAYIGFVDRKHLLKMGRFYLDTPFLNKNSTAFLPYSFKGVSYFYDHMINIAEITHIKKPLSNQFEKPDKKIDFIGLRLPYKSSKLTLYHYEANPFNLNFIKLAGSLRDKKIPGKALFGYEYVNTSDNQFDIHCIKLGLKKQKLGIIMAYLQNNNNTEKQTPLYSGKTKLFVSNIFEDDFSNRAKIYSARLKYDISQNFYFKYIYNTIHYQNKQNAYINGIALKLNHNNIIFDILYESNNHSLEKFLSQIKILF